MNSENPTIDELLASMDDPTVNTMFEGLIELASNTVVRDTIFPRDTKIAFLKATGITIEYPNETTMIIRYLILVLTATTDGTITMTVDMTKFL